MIWWFVRTFNLLEYFRYNIEFYDRPFYVQHKSHFGDHEGYFEKVTFVQHYPKTPLRAEEYVVKRVMHMSGEKSILTNVKRNQLFIHSK